MSLSPEQAKELAAELSALSNQQLEALEKSDFINMSKEEAAEYDKRRARLKEISELLARFKLSTFNLTSIR